jgi:sensor c-di-GMP phosphodiesterase-like protein
MVQNSYQTALVKSTVQVADALALRVVAEGVETEAQADALAALGCHAAQGFLFGRPMPERDFADWWAARRQIGDAPQPIQTPAKTAARSTKREARPKRRDRIASV